MQFVYVLTIKPGGRFGALCWQIAFNIPPTTVQVVQHLKSQPATPFAIACLKLIVDVGAPDTYRSGSQGTPCLTDPGPLVVLHLMRFAKLPFADPVL